VVNGLFLQSRQFHVQAVNIPDDVFAYHGDKILRRGPHNKPANDSGGTGVTHFLMVDSPAQEN